MIFFHDWMYNFEDKYVLIMNYDLYNHSFINNDGYNKINYKKKMIKKLSQGSQSSYHYFIFLLYF